jgi:UDP-N-acetylmuramoyl-tripeptide--D-alanyl-D-alanine ligase
MTIAELATILSAETPGSDLTFTGISKDTRTIKPGNLYIAIIGESLDGHDYIQEAYQKGAVAALVSRQVDCPIPQILVKDTILALGQLGENWRNRFLIPLIGVTGSNGKTTLKNMIAAILTAACHGHAAEVLATEGNLNNTIGLPLMLTRLDTLHRYGVIEMGMNSFDEIAYLTKLTRPSIAVITNAAESHLQGVKDVAGVAKAKGEIFQGLEENGIAILNAQDKFYDYWIGLIGQRKHYSFGLQPSADIYVTFNSSINAAGQSITLHTPQGKMHVNLPLLGQHNALNAAAATAVGLAMHFDLSIIKKGLETVKPAYGRMNEIMLENGIRIIDDTYNANPFSAHAAINALANYTGTRILVLGDMRELGPDAIHLHALTGQRAREAGIDYVFTLGELTAATTEAFGPEKGQHFAARENLIAALKPYLLPGTTILVKGSRSMKMEKVVAELVPAYALTSAH